MKKITIISIALFMSIFSTFAKGEPSWITQKPQGGSAYIGIASAPISYSEYRDKARLSALNDIASQISVQVESTSFLRTVDINGDSKDLFDQRIKEALNTYLGGQELVDTYQTDTHYYVYYKLDKSVYAKYIENKRKEVIKTGLDYLVKGKAFELDGDLINAIAIYVKGLEEIEPYLNLSLSGMYQGRYIDVASELYVSLKGIFSGMALVTNVSQLSIESFKTTREPVAVCLSRDGEALSNILLSAKFVSGEGEITKSVKSDYTGTAIFYVTNVTSKDDVQAINISIDESYFEDLPKGYKSLITTNNLPIARVLLSVTDPVKLAYFDVETNDLPECERLVRSIFVNNYFELTEDVDADIYILYSTELTIENEIPGELYNFNECFCSLSVKIYNNNTQSLLGEYALPNIRVLVPINKSAEQASQMCVREMMKQFKTKLPAVINKIKM